VGDVASPSTGDDLMRTRETLREIGCSRATLSRWCREGKIQPIRIRANEIGFRRVDVSRVAARWKRAESMRLF